jgi:tRNA nucleotidyltransferase (CCA-adding enzyme)
MSVGSVMSADPIVVWPDTSLGDVDELLERYAISGVPVVDPMDFPMGVVSKLDVLRMSEGAATADAWRALDARLAMTTPPVVIDADASVHEAAELLVRRRIHRLVVVDPRSGSVVGVVTATDLLAGLAAAEVPIAGADHPAR